MCGSKTGAAEAAGIECIEQGPVLLPGEAEPAHAILPDQTLVRGCHGRPCYDRYESDAAVASDRWLEPRLRLPVTASCRSWNDFLMSQEGTSARKTRRLPESVSMAAAGKGGAATPRRSR